MKKLLIIAFVALVSCRDESNKPHYETYIVSGNDTIVCHEDISLDLTKCRASSGHNDTVNHVFIVRFTNSFNKNADQYIKYIKAEKDFSEKYGIPFIIVDSINH